MTHNPLVPLGFMAPGESGTLEAIKGLKIQSETGKPVDKPEKHRIHIRRYSNSAAERGQNLERRLKSMGLIPETEIRVLQNSLQGPVIVVVKDSRLCLERSIALKLMIRPLASSEKPGRRCD